MSTPRAHGLPFLLVVASVFSLLSSAASAELTVDKHPWPPHPVLLSRCPGAGAPRACGRVAIRGYHRLRNPSRIFHSLRVRVNITDGGSPFRISTVELCFHRNESMPMASCPSSQWQKLTKNTWSQTISPYDDRILDIRMPDDPSRSVEVCTIEEFLFYRVVFLLVGTMMMAVAHILSASVVFYYGGAMTIGIILVVLIVLFQGMRLLPTGRKSSLAIVLYSSVIGFTTFFLNYLAGILRSALVELGISEDMHNPIGILVVACILLAGAWFGYWGVRKLVLTEDGTIDSSVAYFVEWTILILSAVLILQCSLDYVLAFAALLLSVLIRLISKMDRKAKLWKSLSRPIFRAAKRSIDHLSPARNSYMADSTVYRTPNRTPNSGNRAGPKVEIAETRENYFSWYHRDPNRRKITKQEYEAVTKRETDKAMAELLSSPQFPRWGLANLDRISVAPSSSNTKKRQRLLGWF